MHGSIIPSPFFLTDPYVPSATVPQGQVTALPAAGWGPEGPKALWCATQQNQHQREASEKCQL